MGNFRFLEALFGRSVEKFTDIRDGNKYKVVTVGTQRWMAENLKFTRINRLSKQNKTYGVLYTYQEALEYCPIGWHLPSNEEWRALFGYLGGMSIAGGKMKSTKLWDDPNEGATNSSGFCALPAGFIYYQGASPKFTNLGYTAHFWSSTRLADGEIFTCMLASYTEKAELTADSGRYRHSVRYVRD
jgi:uncharacterized protein (TIGR02145 family)